MLKLVGGGTDVWFGYFPSRLVGVLDRGKLFGMTASESEEAFCRIVLVSLAGGVLGICWQVTVLALAVFALKSPSPNMYCARAVQVLVGSDATGVLITLEMVFGGADVGDTAAPDAKMGAFSVVACGLPGGLRPHEYIC